ncbi:TPA: hypothetical protein J1Y11_004688 [Escherichia coli]|uniref:hypothetical protein n=1 Tax=Escherichia coli TaxID=562 RepID=UPI000E1C8F64|nr:hypothetical protein [Escherichia coli]EEZ5662147.1 hypothetical protein [Escherichia coli O5]MBB7735362.1 hypothetical protein [Escherichia coli]RDP83850.1 hypothetical protein C4A43_03361 [Escherichia coli]HBA7339372.1 hypothetical protein [Escherichia coli]HEI3649875.1 hypothetical protein [Escherichia coli]
MKEKVLFGIAGLAMSFSVFAGGGGSSWQPSVSPAQCIKNQPSPQAQLVWNNTDACNEVVSKGYATGVYVSGLFVYQGGQTTVRFTGAANPRRAEKLNYPESIDGKKFTAVASTNYQWIN